MVLPLRPLLRFVSLRRHFLPLSLATVVHLGNNASAGAQAANPVEPDAYALARARPGEPVWAPLLRLRAASAHFDRDTSAAGRAKPARQVWLQLLAQAEATFGNHDAALRTWDGLGRPSSGDLPAIRRRFGGARRVRVLDTLIAMADTAKVIMVNERHHAASDRVLTLQLLRPLWEKGYRYFAAEAFARDTVTGAAVEPRDDDGYTSEPVFAEVVREARRLGYTLVPYEAYGRQFDEPDSLTPQQRRDQAQARNLHAATFARDPQAKVLVHAGFDHIRERATATWSPMAMYFRAFSGIDPVTVDQTSGTERGTPEFGHPVHQALRGELPTVSTAFIDSTGVPIGAVAQNVDFVAIRGGTPAVDGRPSWLALDGRRRLVRVAVPECRTRHCVVTAHRVRESDSATVLDRTEANRRSAVSLWLPREPVRITVYDQAGVRLRRTVQRGR